MCTAGRIAVFLASAGWCLSADPIAFEDIAPGAGIDFVLRNGATGNHYQIETMVSGVVAFDYDSDGRVDLFFVNGAAPASLTKKHPGDSNRLYRNLGGGKFEDTTARAGLAGEGFGMGGAAADFDNDGHPIYP